MVNDIPPHCPSNVGRNALRVCVCLCLTLFVQSALPESALPQNSISLSYKRLLELDKRLRTIAKDLLQSSKALGNRDPERDNVSSLIASSQRSSNYVAHAMDVLWLYQNMSSATDRQNVRTFVKDSLESLAKFLDLEIEQVNYITADTNKPGIVTTATELRSVVRQIIEVLNGVRL